MARFVCSWRAAWVGGIVYSILPLLVKRCFLVSFTLQCTLVLSYMRETNCSTSRKMSERVSGDVNIFRKTLVNSGSDIHTSQHVFLLTLEKKETVSQPVNAWNIRDAVAFSGPSAVANS